eukprot:7305494-Alexandrium_andersonii.AAC.1
MRLYIALAAAHNLPCMRRACAAGFHIPIVRLLVAPWFSAQVACTSLSRMMARALPGSGALQPQPRNRHYFRRAAWEPRMRLYIVLHSRRTFCQCMRCSPTLCWRTWWLRLGRGAQ